MKAVFNHYDLHLVVPDFRSSLTDLIIELDYLRKKQLFGSTIPRIFFQLKQIFHTLESISSARIEGNNTTILEYIESKLTDRESARAKLMVLARRTLNKYGYPSDKQQKAIDTVLKQAELLADYFVKRQ